MPSSDELNARGVALNVAAQAISARAAAEGRLAAAQNALALAESGVAAADAKAESATLMAMAKAQGDDSKGAKAGPTPKERLAATAPPLRPGDPEGSLFQQNAGNPGATPPVTMTRGGPQPGGPSSRQGGDDSGFRVNGATTTTRREVLPGVTRNDPTQQVTVTDNQPSGTAQLQARIREREAQAAALQATVEREGAALADVLSEGDADATKAARDSLLTRYPPRVAAEIVRRGFAEKRSRDFEQRKAETQAKFKSRLKREEQQEKDARTEQRAKADDARESAKPTQQLARKKLDIVQRVSEGDPTVTDDEKRFAGMLPRKGEDAIDALLKETVGGTDGGVSFDLDTPEGFAAASDAFEAKHGRRPTDPRELEGFVEGN